MPDRTITEIAVLPDLIETIGRVAGVDPKRLSPVVRFDGLEEWTSLTALRLLVGLEQHFGVRLDLREYLAIEHVRGLAAAIARRLSGR